MKRTASSGVPRAVVRRGALLALLGALGGAPVPPAAGLAAVVGAGFVGVAGLAGLALAGSAQAQEQGNAAIVNGQPISVFRLERHFEDFLKERGRNLGAIRDPRAYKRLKREALFELVDRQLLWEAAQAEQVQVPAAALDAAIARLQGAFRNREAYLRRLSAAGFSEAEYRTYLQRIMAGEVVLGRRIDEELMRRYPEADAARRQQEFRAIYQRHKADIDPQGTLGEEAGSRLVAEQAFGRARQEVEQQVRARLREAARIEILQSL